MSSELQTSNRTQCMARPTLPRHAAWARTPILAALLASLAGCQTTSGLPTVDDAQRRPINTAAAIELQSCRAEASALRATLTEAASPQCPRTECSVSVAARMPVTFPTGASSPTAVAPLPAREGASRTGVSRIAVFLFDQGQVSLNLDEASRDALKAAAAAAEVVHVRGRSGSQQESAADVLAARRRAESAVAILKELGVPVQKLRVSWQGMADEGAAPGQGRRVEIEFVDKAPTLLFTKAAAEKVSPAGGTAAGTAPSTSTSPTSNTGGAAGSAAQASGSAPVQKAAPKS